MNSITQRNPSNKSRSLYYENLHLQVRSRIAAVPTGTRIPGDRKLAKDIGTSKVTIARILHELQAEGLVERIPGKGTFPRHRESSPSSKRDVLAPGTPEAIHLSETKSGMENTYVMVLAVLGLPWSIQPLEDNVSLRIALGIEQTLQQKGARTLIVNRFGVEVEDIPKIVHDGLRSGVNRLVYISQPLPESVRSATWENSILHASKGRFGTEIPLVHVTLDPKAPLPANCVSVDSQFGAEIATQHLIDLGHTNIVYAGPCEQMPEHERDWTIDRMRGMRRALQLAGIDDTVWLENQSEVINTPRLLRGDPTPPATLRWDHAGRTVAPKILADPTITAVIAANDEMAAAILDVVTQAGRQVPHDISLVGWDNKVTSAGLGLTTVHIPVDRIVQEATAMLLAPTAANQGRKTQIMFNPMLVTRSTTAPPRKV